MGNELINPEAIEAAFLLGALLPGVYNLGDGKTFQLDDRGSCFWKLREILHREDGPAVVSVYEGRKSFAWMIQGHIHREGAPAVELADGGRRWFQHGKKHREDGPAVVHADGSEEWWINGEQIEGKG